jgi:hypothetical protein
MNKTGAQRATAIQHKTTLGAIVMQNSCVLNNDDVWPTKVENSILDWFLVIYLSRNSLTISYFHHA